MERLMQPRVSVLRSRRNMSLSVSHNILHSAQNTLATHIRPTSVTFVTSPPEYLSEHEF
jgi:hypothetical protein